MSTIERKDLVELGLSLLPDQWKKSPNVINLCKIYFSQLQEIEDALHQLNDERSIYTAQGVQLDVIGLLVNEKRLGRTDSDYREALLNRIANNGASGTPPDIKRIAKLLTQATEARIFEHYPASTYIYVNKPVSYAAARSIEQAHVGGVGTRILWHEDGHNILKASFGEGVLLQVPIVDENGDPILVDTETGQYILVTGETSTAPGGSNTLTSLVPGAEEFQTVDDRGKLASIAPRTFLEVQTGFIIDEHGNYIVDQEGNNIRYINF